MRPKRPAIRCLLFGHRYRNYNDTTNGVQLEAWECERCGSFAQPRNWTPQGFETKAVEVR